MNLSEKLATELNHFLKTITYENNGKINTDLNKQGSKNNIKEIRLNHGN